MATTKWLSRKCMWAFFFFLITTDDLLGNWLEKLKYFLLNDKFIYFEVLYYNNLLKTGTMKLFLIYWVSMIFLEKKNLCFAL